MLTVLIYIYVAVFVLFFFGFCIFIHEVGHFLAAKWRKMHIVAFSIGFKKIWGFKHKGIEYRIGCLPFGGYVDIPQLEPSDTPIEDENGKKLPPIKPFDRIIVAFAGPFFNILFGFALGTLLWIHGVPQSTPKMSSIKVATIVKKSPEYKAGLRVGNDIVRVNGKSFYTSWNGFVRDVLFTIGDVKLGIQQKDKIKSISYYPAVNPAVPGMAKEGLPYPFFKPEIPIIIQVASDSQAAKDGLKSGDRIIKINGIPIIDHQDYTRVLDDCNGKQMDVVALRNNKEVALKITPSPYAGKNRYFMGVALDLAKDSIVIKNVSKGSPAEKAGIKVGDIILNANNIHLANIHKLVETVNNSKGKQVNLLVKRDNKDLNISVIPKLYYVLKGISVTFFDHTNPWQQFINVMQLSYKSLQGIFSKGSRIQAKHLAGPIGIVTVIGRAVYHGSIFQALNIIVLITFSLALLNLLPLPVLDGGHILISLIEIVTRRRIPTRFLQPICIIFIVLLIALMIFVTFNDVNRITNFTKYFHFGKKATPVQTTPIIKD